MSELSSFKRSLRKEDQERFEAMMNYAAQHYGSITYTASYQTWAFIILSILLEHEHKLSHVPTRRLPRERQHSLMVQEE
jgi:hypothetical protein